MTPQSDQAPSPAVNLQVIQRTEDHVKLHHEGTIRNIHNNKLF